VDLLLHGIEGTPVPICPGWPPVLTQNSLLLHNSIQSLERIARGHDAQIEELREITTDLGKQWQAYINTLPRS
jgi:hypothetical protein